MVYKTKFNWRCSLTLTAACQSFMRVFDWRSARIRVAADEEGCRRLFGRRRQGYVVECHPAMRVQAPMVDAGRENSDAQDGRPAGQAQKVEQHQSLTQTRAPSHIPRLAQPSGNQPRNFLRHHPGIRLETGRWGQPPQQPFERKKFFQQRNDRCQQPDVPAQNQPSGGGCGVRVLQQ